MLDNQTFEMTFTMNLYGESLTNWTKCANTANHTFNATFDVFTSWSKGLDSSPTEFDYDFVIWGSPCNSSITITDKMVQKSNGLVIAVRVNGFDTRLG